MPLYFGYGVDAGYLVVVLVALVLGTAAQAYIRSTYRKWSQVDAGIPGTGAEVARVMLADGGASGVGIARVAGSLTDHYDPRDNKLHLSEDNYRGASVASLAVACHEAGHAIQAAQGFFPYRLRVALPPLLDRTRLQQAADYHGVHIDFVSTPEEAVEGVDFVFAGCRGGLDDETQEQWRISEALMSRAAPNAHLLLGSTPMYTVQVDRSVLCSPASLLLLQAENRLRVHKRVLHWLFNENEREI